MLYEPQALDCDDHHSSMLDTSTTLSILPSFDFRPLLSAHVAMTRSSLGHHILTRSLADVEERCI